MRMRTLAALGVLSGFAALGVARAQSSAGSADPWDLRQTAESCYLSRTFPDGANGVELRIESFGRASPYHFVLIGKGLPIRRGVAVHGRVGFGGAGAAKDAIVLVGDYNKVPTVVFPVAPPRQMHMYRWLYAFKRTKATTLLQLDESAQTLFIDFADTDPITLPLGSMAAEYARLNDCTEAVADKQALAAAVDGSPVTKPHLLHDDELYRSAKYPQNLLLNRLSGLVELRMRVDKDGRAQDCVVQRAIWVRQFGSDTCAAVERWARFKPALDASGNPVSATYQTAAMYMIYRW